MATTPTTIDEYILGYPVEVRSILERIRALIQRLSSKPVLESIKYGMPAFVIEGRHTIYVAAWKKHVGFYAVPKAPSALERELEEYRSDKYQHNLDIQPSLLYKELNPDAEKDPQLKLNFGMEWSHK